MEKGQHIDWVPKYNKVLTAEQMNILNFSSIVESNEFQYVYEPSDDTYLMLSTLKYELSFFTQDAFLCEIGSGSGIISANLHHWLIQANKIPLVHISIDLNMDASTLSKRYYDKYNLNIQQINSSIFNNFIFTEANQAFKPEIIIFNPPYVPVEQEEIDNQQKYLIEKLKFVRENRGNVRRKQQNLIAYSYMGGTDGLKITRKILNQINWTCIAYFIVMGKEGLQSIKQEIQQRQDNQQNGEKSSFQLLQFQQNPNEQLFVVKARLLQIVKSCQKKQY